MRRYKISIIMPTYNREDLIPQTIKSFLNQSYSEWELIIIDDGCEDKTPEKVNTFRDKRIRYFKRSEQFKKGPCGCRNFGLSKATGEYILFFDDDDIAHPDLLKFSIKEFQEKDIDFCRYLREVFYNNFNFSFDMTPPQSSFKIGISDLDKIVANRLPFNTCAVVWKRSALLDEKFNEDLFYSDEWEYYQRIISNGVKGISLNKVLLYARKHGASSTHNFKTSETKYINSTREAMVLVLNNLSEKKILSPELFSFFIRSGFSLKDYRIIKETLKQYNSGLLAKVKYKLGFIFYPGIKPFLNLKGKIIGRKHEE